MTDLNQNISLVVGNDMDVLYDIGPDDQGTNLAFAEELSWKAYAQTFGVPVGLPLITKGVGSGIAITDPLLMQFTVSLAGADTLALSGNYFYAITLVANHGQTTTLTTGLMTVIDPTEVPNVISFKTMFPDFADVDDTTVQIALDAASQFVDDSWGESEPIASMYLAAHFLSMAAITSDASGRLITSESIGRISVSYAAGVGSGGSGTLAQTNYGTVFNTMLTAQGFGIAVI